MKNLTFGKKGLAAETPRWVKLIYRGIMLASALWMVVIQPNFEFTPVVEAAVNKWIGVFNTGFYLVCQYIGYAEPKDETNEG